MTDKANVAIFILLYKYSGLTSINFQITNCNKPMKGFHVMLVQLDSRSDYEKKSVT